MLVLETTFTFVAAVPPNVTVAPLAKFVPVIVVVWPPVDGPLLGFRPLMVGAGLACGVTVKVPSMFEWPLPHVEMLQANWNVPLVVAVKVFVTDFPRPTLNGCCEP